MTELAKLRRRVSRARQFPRNTCAASRALVAWAEDVLRIGSVATMEGEHETVAECMLAAVAALWETRTKLERAQTQADFYRKRCDLLQQLQSRMRGPERTLVCDVLANGGLLPDPSGARYGMAHEDSE